MSVEWQHQLRIYLPEEVAKIARTDAKAPALKRLTDVLAAHRATLVNQLDAFEAYVAEAEREGLDKYPLYKWTKATLEDPAKRLKHIRGACRRPRGLLRAGGGFPRCCPAASRGRRPHCGSIQTRH